jgi:multidrug transporter EmrE-like cation transporter
MSLSFYLSLGTSMAIFLGAASASRAYVGNDYWPYLVLSLFLYCVGNLVMLKIMRESGMGIAFAVSSIAQLILVNVIAFVVFGERLTALQYAGLALGLVSIGMIVFPASGKG